MAKKRPPAHPGAVERFKVARGAIADARRALTVLMLSLVGWLVVAGALAAAFGSSVFGGAMFGGFVALVLSALVYLNLPGYLELGQDGVNLALRDRRRYVPFADLAGAVPYKEAALGKVFVGVALSLTSREVVKVAMGEDLFGEYDKATALAARISNALATYHRRADAEHTAALSRGDRPIAAWREQLQRLAAGANAGPRQAPVSPERLWRIALDPGADAPLRAAAAVALGPGLDADGRQKLRLAAEETAAPRLRVALESVASGDEEALAEALDKVEEEAAR